MNTAYIVDKMLKAKLLTFLDRHIDQFLYL